MGRVSEDPPTGFSHAPGTEQSAVVVAALAATTGDGTLKPRLEVMLPAKSRFLAGGTLGPMA